MYQSKKYRDFIKSKPCTKGCQPPPSWAHHVKVFKGGGMGIKPPDCHCVPLCDACHKKLDSINMSEKAFWWDDGYDIDRIVRDLMTEYMKLMKV